MKLILIAAALIAGCVSHAKYSSSPMAAPGLTQRQLYGGAIRVMTRNGLTLRDKDPEKARRVMAAMLQMVKLDIATLEKAYDGR